MSEYYRDGYYWRKKSEPWEIEFWGFQVDSLGDIIYETCRKIIEDEDQTPWAIISFALCEDLLRNGKRWPDRMEEEVPRKQKWRSWPIIRLIYFGHRPGDYRTQQSITRDPWTLLYACAVHLGMDPKELPRPQWWIYRPTFGSWIRKLKGKWNLYEFWRDLMPPSKQQYVIDLQRFKEGALK